MKLNGHKNMIRVVMYYESEIILLGLNNKCVYSHVCSTCKERYNLLLGYFTIIQLKLGYFQEM